MEISDAIQLINHADLQAGQPTVWADLGAGSGVFTAALASLLPPGSTIYAVDKSLPASRLPDYRDVQIEWIQADFDRDALSLPDLDGILMANSLHYIAKPKQLLERMQQHLNRADGQFIIVEYNIIRANPWVPYPLNFNQLQALFKDIDFAHIRKLGERPSAFGQGNLYACAISKG